MELVNIAKQFKLSSGDIVNLKKYGEGHINTTYLLQLRDGTSYIMQKINHHVFPNFSALMKNIALLLDYLQQSTNDLVDPKRQIMNIVRTNKDELFFYDKDEGSYYRVYDFVTESIAFQKIDNADVFKESAIGYGKFALDLQGFDASQLFEVIPNFHNTRARFNQFLKMVDVDKIRRKNTCLKEINFVIEREHFVGRIVDKIDQGLIPLRVTHNDTKLNNILLDNKTFKSLCVIDLDTIMPGSLLYDFGDSIRV